MNYKIFIINLESALNRRNNMKSQFVKYGINNYEFINAVKAVDIDYDIELPKQLDREHLGEDYRRKFNRTEIACMLSHVKAVKRAKELNLDYVIILEDDVIICEDWNKRLEKLLKLTPKSWNHIYLSGEPNEDIQSQQFRPLNFAPFLHVEKSIDTMSAFSYAIKNDVYDKFINNVSNNNLPVDDTVKDMIKNNELKSYTFYPFLSYHDNETPSTIWDKNIWEKQYNVDHESKRFFIKKI